MSVATCRSGSWQQQPTLVRLALVTIAYQIATVLPSLQVVGARLRVW